VRFWPNLMFPLRDGRSPAVRHASPCAALAALDGRAPPTPSAAGTVIVQQRHLDDRATVPASSPHSPPDGDERCRAAVGGMDGASPRPAADDGFAPRAPGRVEWLRLWRRMHLPDRLAAYGEQLARARTERDVYAALATHAVRIVGGYTCLVFVPRGATAALRPAMDPGLRFDPELLTLSEPPASPGVIGLAASASGGPFAALRPLFTEEGAAALALAPFGARGMVVLVERRERRAFTGDDCELLRVLSVQAEAALEQARVWARAEPPAAADPVTGLVGPGHLHAVVARAAGWGEPVAVAMLAQGGPGGASHPHGAGPWPPAELAGRAAAPPRGRSPGTGGE
jgi:hypothetical protein